MGRIIFRCYILKIFGSQTLHTQSFCHVPTVFWDKSWLSQQILSYRHAKTCLYRHILWTLKVHFFTYCRLLPLKIEVLKALLVVLGVPWCHLGTTKFGGFIIWESHSSNTWEIVSRKKTNLLLIQSSFYNLRIFIFDFFSAEWLVGSAFAPIKRPLKGLWKVRFAHCHIFVFLYRRNCDY